MKISIGTKIKNGPWGGGNLFAVNMKKYFQNNGHVVINDLQDEDIDIIIITEPRKTSESSAFTHIDVKNYLNFVNPNTLVVHRINECDERKGTNYVNKFLIEANKTADYTVFVSNWLKKLYVNQGINNKQNHVILAGADKEVFNNLNLTSWSPKQKFKIVTHHWGANWNKGFEVYQKLDNLLGDESFNKKFSFTYIGNLPNNFRFKHSTVIEPMHGLQLSNEIKKHHLYLTASLNEPSGNHHIEGAQCGLPLLYINSGGIPEYCEGFGLKFNSFNFEQKLNEIYEDYSKYKNMMSLYPFSSDKMCLDYENLFKIMLSNKEIIISERVLNKNKNIFNKIFYKFKRSFNQK